jgi:hypothetical protein
VWADRGYTGAFAEVVGGGVVREAVACHFEDAERPAIIRLHFTREEVIAA